MTKFYLRRTHVFIVNALVVGALNLTAREVVTRPPEETNLEVRYTAAAPNLDGRPDDDCWTTAAVADGFTLIGGEAYPSQKTEVRVLYDIQNLYILFTCFDTEIENLRSAAPAEDIDNDVTGDDSVEIFLDTNHDHKTYFQMMASALPATMDMSNTERYDWHGDWEVRASQNEEAWYLEFSIPFIVLANTGETASTPMPGDVWGVNFNRGIPRTSEWINWSVCGGGFHAPARFGQLIFQERADKTMPVIVAQPAPAPGFGRNVIPFSVRNPRDTAVTVDFRLWREHHARETGDHRFRSQTKLLDVNKDDVHTVTVPARARIDVEVPFSILNGGRMDVFIEVSDGADAVWYEWRTPLHLPDLAEMLADTRGTVERMQELARAAGDAPDMRPLAPGIEEASSTLRKLSDRFKKRETFPDAEWQAFRQELNEAIVRVSQLERRVLTTSYALLTRQQIPGARFCVGQASVFDQVFSDELFRGRINKPVELSLARHECESAQVVLVPFDELRNVRCSVTDLVREDGITVGSEHVDVARVLNAWRERPDNAAPEFREAWPDPLLPFTEPANLDGSQVHPLWITVYVPENQKPGLYKGTLTVEADAAPPLSIPLAVRVYDFTLPFVPALETDMWLALGGFRDWYSLKGQKQQLEFYEKAARFCQRHRIGPYPYDTAVTSFRTKIIREKDGSYRFDFSAIDDYMEIAFRHGVSGWNVNFSCNDRWAGLFAGGYGRPLRLYDQATGKTEPYPPDGHPVLDMPAHSRTAWVWENSELFREFLRQYWRHIQEKGWDKAAYWESVDEPNTISRMKKMQRDYAIVRQEMPGLRTLSFGVPHVGRHEGAGRGYITQWAPALTAVPHLVEELREYKQRGDKVWTYTCSRNSNPNSMIQSPLIMKRIIPWMCWRYDMDGYLCFAMSVYLGLNPQFKMSPEERWPNSPWVWQKEEGGFGQNYYVYPGPDGICSSLRLEHLRDGIEDFDYLAILRDKLKALRRRGRESDREFVSEARKLLAVDPELVQSVSRYTSEGARILERRGKLAAAIEQAGVLWLTPPVND